MKLAFILLSIVVGFHSNELPLEDDLWWGNIKAAQDHAGRDGKSIFVEVYARWCTSCRLMEETTFKSPQVLDMLATYYVPVRIDIEQIEGKLFAAQHNISALPTLLVLDRLGEAVHKVSRAMGEREIMEVLGEYAHEVSPH